MRNIHPVLTMSGRLRQEHWEGIDDSLVQLYGAEDQPACGNAVTKVAWSIMDVLSKPHRSTEAHARRLLPAAAPVDPLVPPQCNPLIPS